MQYQLAVIFFIIFLWCLYATYRMIENVDFSKPTPRIYLSLVYDAVDNYYENVTLQPTTIIHTSEIKVISNTVQRITNCRDVKNYPKISYHGDFIVLLNYVRAEKTFGCSETITLTTHSESSCIENIVPLVEKWEGPISLAIYAPGSDFDYVLNAILRLRQCETPLIKNLVTFHIFFETQHVPHQVPSQTDLSQITVSCNKTSSFDGWNNSKSFKVKNELLYPINVARNIAREAATTHFVLSSDIELYPSPNIITMFLRMVSRNETQTQPGVPRVFPLHVFEIAKGHDMPKNKTLIRNLIHEGTMRLFHKGYCTSCHRIPKTAEWLNGPNFDGEMHIHAVTKRIGSFAYWEPFYIGTRDEPFWHEWYTWEGKSNKMVQAYAMCLLNYDFAVLSNGFLVHKPGFKKGFANKSSLEKVSLSKTISLTKEVKTHLQRLFSIRNECKL